jgi:hypothetical protein
MARSSLDVPMEVARRTLTDTKVVKAVRTELANAPWSGLQRHPIRVQIGNGRLDREMGAGSWGVLLLPVRLEIRHEVD